MKKSYDKLSNDTTRLRAVVEIIDGELVVFPLADSDEHREQILDALRFLSEGRE